MENLWKSLKYIKTIYRISQKVSTCSAYVEVAPMDPSFGCDQSVLLGVLGPRPAFAVCCKAITSILQSINNFQ